MFSKKVKESEKYQKWKILVHMCFFSDMYKLNTCTNVCLFDRNNYFKLILFSHKNLQLSIFSFLLSQENFFFSAKVLWFNVNDSHRYLWSLLSAVLVCSRSWCPRVLYAFACFTRLRAWRAYVLGVLLKVGVFGVLQKMVDLACFKKNGLFVMFHKIACLICFKKIGVLGVFHKMACLMCFIKLLICFLVVFDHGALVNCRLWMWSDQFNERQVNLKNFLW